MFCSGEDKSEHRTEDDEDLKQDWYPSCKYDFHTTLVTSTLLKKFVVLEFRWFNDNSISILEFACEISLNVPVILFVD